jgi:hypothetical protein
LAPTFGSIHPIAPLIADPSSLALGDFNGDGHLDLAVTSRRTGLLAWYAGNGEAQNNWVPRVVQRNLAEAAVVVAVDLDLDGDDDLVSLSAGAGILSWHENALGTGEAWVWHLVATGLMFPEALAVADLDGDADLDLVVGGQAPDALIVFEDFTGRASAWTRHDLPEEAPAVVAVEVADLDGDGLPEIASVGRAGDWVRAFTRPDVASDWVGAPIFPAGEIRALRSADLDGDQRIDLISSSPGAERLDWHTHPANAEAWQSLPIATEVEAGQSLAIADINGDGRPDVVAGGGFAEEALWYEMQGDNFQGHLVAQSPQQGFSLFAVGDVDGDGRLDVFLAEGQTSRLSWHHHLDTGGFLPHSVDQSPRLGDGLSLVDVDGDGVADVVSASLTDAVATWISHRSDPQDPWRSSPLLSGSGTHAYADAADLDGDGDVDVAFAQPFGSEVIWAENNGEAEPTFTLRAVADLAGASRVEAADINADGNPDLLVWSGFDGAVRWMENALDPGGVWIPHLLAENVTDLRGWAVADLDGDADLDLVTASYEGHTIDWHENVDAEAGAWISRLVTADLYSPLGVAAGDLDGDGDMDLLPEGVAGPELTWYENLLGDGSAWPRRPTTGAPTAVDSTHLVDLDGDGDLDVIARVALDETLSVLTNDEGDATLFSLHPIRPQHEALTLLSGDIDGDGDLDLVAADSAVEWIENLRIHDNIAPQAVDDELVVHRGALGTILISRAESVSHNDLDLNGDVLTVDTLPRFGPTHGHLTLREDGTFTYAHDGRGAQTDEFGYRVCDDGLPTLCDEGRVRIRIPIPPRSTPGPDGGGLPHADAGDEPVGRRGQGCTCGTQQSGGGFAFFWAGCLALLAFRPRF